MGSLPANSCPKRRLRSLCGPQLPLAGRSLRRHPRYVATVTLDSALAREGRLQPSATTRDGAARAVAERRKRAACPELLRRGPQTLCMRACETGGWNDESLRLALVAQLVRLRALRPPVPLRGPPPRAGTGGRLLSVAVQNTLAATLLGSSPIATPMPGAQAPTLQDVLHDAYILMTHAIACPSCLPTR